MTLPATVPPLDCHLTPRELEVFALVAIDLPYKQIAKRMGISEQTVRSHVRHAKVRLGVSSNAAVVLRFSKVIQQYLGKEKSMFSQTILVEPKKMDQVKTTLIAMGNLSEARYQTEERIQLTITTEDQRLAEAVRSLLCTNKPAPEIEQSPKKRGRRRSAGETTEKEIAESLYGSRPNFPDLPTESGSNKTTGTKPVIVLTNPFPPGIASSRVEHTDGLTACNLEERSLICPHCQHTFIRTEKGQTHCKKPSCQRAARLAKTGSHPEEETAA